MIDYSAPADRNACMLCGSPLGERVTVCSELCMLRVQAIHRAQRAPEPSAEGFRFRAWVQLKTPSGGG